MGTTTHEEPTARTSAMLPGESSRFISILRRHQRAKSEERHRLREELIKYILFSPESESLINELINECVEMKSTDRFEIAIDVLSRTGEVVCDYTKKFRLFDLKNWSGLYPDKEYTPNNDYWYILLRSVAQCDVDDSKKLYLIGMCYESSQRQILEAVVESLADIESEESRQRLRHFTTNKDPFIAELASDLLDQE